jgi:hypothetical protein
MRFRRGKRRVMEWERLEDQDITQGPPEEAVDEVAKEAQVEDNVIFIRSAADGKKFRRVRPR